MLDEAQILLDELSVEGGRVRQAGTWGREEGLFGGWGGWCRSSSGSETAAPDCEIAHL
jgi:hypothetical protein